MNRETVDLSVTLGKIKLKNPVMPAAGTFGYGQEFADLINLEDLGAVIVKSITLNPRMGSFQNRVVEIPGGVVDTQGLQNVGVDRFIEDKLPYFRQFGTPVIVSIAGGSIEEFARLTQILNKAEGIAGIEINLQCPNTEKHGIAFGAVPDITFEVVKAVRDATDLTIIPKVTPIATDITVISKVCEEARADAICVVPTAPAMAIDINTRRSKLGKNLTGGTTGACFKPVAIKAVWQVAQIVKIPIVGGGGITSAEDALEFFIAGATAVEIGSYNLLDPRGTIKIIAGIRKYLMDNEVTSISDIIGSFESQT